MTVKRLLFLVGTFISTCSLNASAAVMTFSGVPTSPTPISYTEVGMTVTGNPNIWSWPSNGQLHLDPSGFGNSVMNFSFGGLPFDVQSIDLVFTSGGSVLFQGFDSSNNLVASLNEPSTSNHTVNFSGFNNITTFRITDTGPHLTVDNLNFTPAAAVPEPSTFAIFGIFAAFGVGCWLYRRQRLGATAVA